MHMLHTINIACYSYSEHTQLQHNDSVKKLDVIYSHYSVLNDNITLQLFFCKTTTYKRSGPVSWNPVLLYFGYSVVMVMLLRSGNL